ncbi:hypothetical protein FP026_08415 [Rhizobium tropici]|uniref:Uncharacterized protein n=1 Tax=Rhizobium tropici TaxID=398 RepID=A0A5B0W550_RHITR|nr:hypothetical protein [Rhizobium tropici]KAA1182100.1 hypothetical protein FP026_08415 [Rhizobium tropici]
MNKELVAGVIGAIVGALAAAGGSYLTFLNKDKELDIEMTRLGLCLMATTNFAFEGQEQASKYASALISKYSGVPTGDVKHWLVTDGGDKFLKTPLCSFEHK